MKLLFFKKDFNEVLMFFFGVYIVESYCSSSYPNVKAESIGRKFATEKVRYDIDKYFWHRFLLGKPFFAVMQI